MVENRVSETILEKPVTVKVAGRVFNVARPTLATLMEVSRISAKFPSELPSKDVNALQYVLSKARDYGDLIAEVAAVLINGSKPQKIRWFWRKNKEEDIKAWLINNASCEEICNIVTVALNHQKIGFFLSTFISLSGTSLTKPTKETEATAFGE